MKYRKEIQVDGENKLRVITTTAKVPDVIAFMTKKNPNDHNTDVAPDIVATDLNSASKEYIKWVKDSLKKRDEGEDDPEKIETSDVELNNLNFY